MILMQTLMASSGDVLPSHLDPVRLFLDADLLVRIVISGLILASIGTWTIIASFTLRIRRAQKHCDAYEREFWQSRDIETFQKERGSGQWASTPSARLVSAALSEWRRSTGAKAIDREATRQRIATAMDSAIGDEAEQLADRLNFLATVASSAPFVGLFGTVWGIMNSFFQIGQAQNTSLAVVAPGISQALFATAVGLFAAIPAQVAYNRFSHRVNGFEAHLQRFADRFYASLSRDLDSV